MLIIIEITFLIYFSLKSGKELKIQLDKENKLKSQILNKFGKNLQIKNE